MRPCRERKRNISDCYCTVLYRYIILVQSKTAQDRSIANIKSTLSRLNVASEDAATISRSALMFTDAWRHEAHAHTTAPRRLIALRDLLTLPRPSLTFVTDYSDSFAGIAKTWWSAGGGYSVERTLYWM